MLLVIGFIGRPPTRESMRAPLAVPFDEASEPGPEIPASHWDITQPCVFVLQSTNETFNHSNASVLTNGTEPGFDLSVFAPALEAITPELFTLVREDVLWLDGVLLDRAIQELLNCPGTRRLSEDHQSHGAA